MKTKKLVWRLGKLPTVEELQQLVKDEIITKEEARDILFNQETTEDRDKKDLQSEITFLRKLVEQLSSKNTIVETIRGIQVPYINYDWYKPYNKWITYCSNTSEQVSTESGTLTTAYPTFSAIQTF